MKRNRLIFWTLCLTLAIFLAVAFAEDSRDKAVLIAANEWLMLVDDGMYAKSWDNASEYFKNALSSEDWEKSLAAVRSPLGKMITRLHKGIDYHTSLPGAPDGEYAVVIYKTTFTHKQSATEFVTHMRQEDGSWKVAGYYIK